MGSDFPEKATRTFKKSWDRARVELGTPDLFTRQPENAPRSIVVEITGNAVLNAGELIILELQGQHLVAVRGNIEVARCQKPRPDLVIAVGKSFGLAKGIVEQVHDLAGVAEIFPC